MRYVTLRATHREDEPFHPIGAAVSDEPSIEPVGIHQLETLSDGSGIALTEVRRGLDAYREILADSAYVEEYTVTGADRGFAYTHFEFDELTRRLISFRRESELMIDMPIEFDADGSMYVTFLGDETAFSDAFESAPAEVELTVLETGEYDPDARELFDRLTPRQQEILETAVREGYYADPRQVTHADLAERFDLSPATVGEHLRKIESRVFSRLVTGGQ